HFGGRGLLLQRLGKVLARLGQLRPRFGELPSACVEFLFQFGRRLVPPVDVRPRLRFGRTNLATARPALQAFARQHHPQSPHVTSPGSGLPGLRKYYASPRVCEPFTLIAGCREARGQLPRPLTAGASWQSGLKRRFSPSRSTSRRAEPFTVPAPMIWGLVILRQTFVRRSQNCVAWAATTGRPSFDHLRGAGEQRGRSGEAQHPRGCVQCATNPYELQMTQCLLVTMGHAVVTLDPVAA